MRAWCTWRSWACTTRGSGAFSLGRGLALADSEFRSALLAFRKAARQAARRLLAFPELNALAEQDAAAVAGTRVAQRAFDRLLGENGPLARTLARPGSDLKAAGRRPAPRTASPPQLSSTRLRSAVADTSTRAVLAAAVQSQLEPVRTWLTRLTKLEMMPFGHLVPYEEFLPQESLKFFHVDPDWIDAAVDGALSVGVGHALDADLNDLAREMRGIPQAASGVMIRSQLVAHWPHTRFTAFSKDKVIPAAAGADPRRGPADPAVPERRGPVRARRAGAGPALRAERRHHRTALPRRSGRPGAPGDFPASGGYCQFLRPGGRDVLDIKNRLAPALAAAHGVRELSSAQFALQMVRAPLLQEFRPRQAHSGGSAEPTEGTL